jgi:hypothetical protein
MRHILTILFFGFITMSALSKGGSGIYYIKGKAYGGINKVVLRNVDLMVKINGKETFIKTDDNGCYEIEVNWRSACPSGISKSEWEIKTNELNPKSIFVKFKDIEIEIENNWKKYAEIFPKSKEKVTRKKDLYFD